MGRMDRARIKVSLGAALLALTTALGGCDDSTSAGTSSMSILLTDAPGDVQEAWVEITGIYVQGTPSAPGEKMWLLEGSTGLIDLLTLDGQTETLVADAIIEPGMYAQLRFIVGEAALVIEGENGVAVYATQDLELAELNAARQAADPEVEELSGIDGSVQCPSCSQTGFKVNLPGGAVSVDGEAKVLVVDFDVSQTFGRQAGLSGEWVMNPTLSATEFGLSGSIAGDISWAGDDPQLECGGGIVTVADFRPTAEAGDVMKGAIPEEDGSYTISFAEPGTWTIGFESVTFDNGDVLTFVAGHPASVEVVSGGTATADFTIESASCN